MADLHPPPLPWNDAPLAPPGRYNLQGLMENHAFVGEAVIESAVGWLNAAQIESLLLAAEANLIPISTDPAPEGTTGLFVYNTRAYNDHRMYHHVGPTSLIARQTLVNGDSFVKMGEAIGFNNNRYRKRVPSLGDYPLQVHRSPRALKVIIMMIGALNLPDTLNSLIKRGFPEESKQMIRSIQGTDEVEEEFQDLIDASEKSKQVKHPWKDISVPRYRPQLIMTCFVPFFQQLTGINKVDKNKDK
ncbi:hypothetical protein Bca101_004464 [Brassica carinata]